MSTLTAAPVYNKTQYPRISLSCIFNDFLGEFGRSVAEGGNDKDGGMRGTEAARNWNR